ncbi:hypothetical protein DPMN_024456 [Dreissena polymorpha]|uniref:Uncharacterized protein n=1 Tax=Dreissena polymorpha TaxID=45954 RepID=A0A9D4RAX8_DREPO|nr:hypothetical protein DPMN_024456 [Dreissena polymorpha]
MPGKFAAISSRLAARMVLEYVVFTVQPVDFRKQTRPTAVCSILLSMILYNRHFMCTHLVQSEYHLP